MRLLADMPPSTPFENDAHSRFRDTELRTYVFEGVSVTAKLKNLWYVSTGNFRPRCVVAKENAVAPFSDHVQSVVGIRTKKEVIWIAARRIIALVKNMKQVWDRTIRNFPCTTIGTYGFSAMVGFPISVLVFASQPWPTPIAGCVNIGPEVFWSRARRKFAVSDGALIMRIAQTTTNGLPIARRASGIFCHEQPEFLQAGA